MNTLLLIKFGELGLKGDNRPYFVDALVKNMRRHLRGLGKINIKKTHGRVFVEVPEECEDDAVSRLQKVFGLVGVCKVNVADKILEDIAAISIKVMKDALEQNPRTTFKVVARRADKRFPMESPEIGREIGAAILQAIPELKVDVHNPEVALNIEIRDQAYIYTDNYPGLGGLPYGVSGRGALLLSGGIDSPVAGWMAMKRGVEVIGVHFYSFPFTSERAKDKVIELTKILAGFSAGMHLYVIGFTDIQKRVIAESREDYVTIVMRRMMMRIAEKVAIKENARCLLTGESIGQVASQTIESLYATNEVVKMPVFRPVVGMDKEEIVTIAKRIGTYETSILPYEDCCTVFVPKHPATRPQEEELLAAEQGEGWDEMLDKAVAEAEILHISGV